jgi:hypothetical protein
MVVQSIELQLPVYDRHALKQLSLNELSYLCKELKVEFSKKKKISVSNILKRKRILSLNQDLHSKTLPELRLICKDLNIKVSGKKADVIKRIMRTPRIDNFAYLRVKGMFNNNYNYENMYEMFQNISTQGLVS